MLLVGFGVGGWAVSTEISGAVIAQGLVVVELNVKKVQHPTGGVVAELRARNGDRVRAGDLLVRLDDTTTRANLAVVVKALDELAARQTRLEAERDGAEKLSFPALLTGRMSDPEVARIVNGESRLFELRSDRSRRPEVPAQGAHHPARSGDRRPLGASRSPRSARSCWSSARSSCCASCGRRI